MPWSCVINSNECSVHMRVAVLVKRADVNFHLHIFRFLSSGKGGSVSALWYSSANAQIIWSFLGDEEVGGQVLCCFVITWEEVPEVSKFPIDCCCLDLDSAMINAKSMSRSTLLTECVLVTAYQQEMGMIWCLLASLFPNIQRSRF